MLSAFSEFIIALIELVEAELRSARKESFRLGLGLMFFSIAATLFIAAIALILYSIYLVLSSVVYPSSAVFICSLIILGMAGGFLWLAKIKMD